jgi:DNA-directed RNA polymerase specialized sigma24 family protein
MVGGAGQAESLAREGALAALLKRYLPALKVYLMRKRKLDADSADDLLQSFVGEKVLDVSFIAAADRRRGKFRTFLLTSLDNFLIDQVRSRDAAMRAEIAAAGPAGMDGNEPAARDAPDPFDIAWARQVINEALGRMEQECTASGRPDLWTMFDQRVAGPTLQDRPAPSYEQLVAHFGFQSPTQASNCLVTAKRMFARTLREVVMEYAGEDDTVEAELCELMQILSHGRARSG